MQNSIYTGFLVHSRLLPIKHKFKYLLTMFFLDIDDIPSQCQKSPFISYDKLNVLSFYRKNYLPTTDQGSIREQVEKNLKKHNHTLMPARIFILTQLSYLGYCYNPVSFYYCYDANDCLIYLLAEVNNTPWNERHVYVEKIDSQNKAIVKLEKAFHVSPFLPLDMQYIWSVYVPSGSIKLRMECIKQQPVFYAAINLKRRNLNAKNILIVALTNPFATLVNHLRIYKQALGLYLKKAPFYAHAQRKN